MADKEITVEQLRRNLAMVVDHMNERFAAHMKTITTLLDLAKSQQETFSEIVIALATMPAGRSSRIPEKDMRAMLESIAAAVGAERELVYDASGDPIGSRPKQLQ